MARYLKHIGIFILAVVVWQMADAASNDSFCPVAVGENHQQERAAFTLPPLPYFPDAELASICGYTQTTAFSRSQRLQSSIYVQFIKNGLDGRFPCAVALSRYGRGVCQVAFLPYDCACDYYVFALRRILL